MLAIDLFCGLGGWAEGLLAEGYTVIGFDIEQRPYPAQLVLQDVKTLHGSQFRNADLIVASPPCQEYSYRAMPWKRAKALPPPDNTLFNACWRIQREASEAAGRYIPMVVENVNGAQKWVGRARWHFGSYYLWGDVPALMPLACAVKVPGKDWNRFKDTGEKTPWWNGEGQKIERYSDPRRNGGKTARLTSQIENNRRLAEGVKGFAGRFEDTPWAWHLSRSSARKQASAAIAKIPFPLARHIAQVYKNGQETTAPSVDVF